MDDIEEYTKGTVFLTSKNNIIVAASNGFMRLAGYSLAELLGKTLSDISQMLRIDAQTSLEEIQESKRVYLFTQSLELREVTISCSFQILENPNEKTFFFGEHSTSRIEEQFKFSQQLYPNRKTGIIILCPDNLVIIKVSQRYLNHFPPPYNVVNNALGKAYHQIAPAHISSTMESYSYYTQKTGKPYYVQKGLFEHSTGENKYWDSSTVPFFEDGKIKYLIHSTLNVTNRVLSQEIVKQKNRELEAIIENISEELLIVNQSGQLISVNKAARSNYLCDVELSGNLKENSKNLQIFDLNGNEIPIENRPAQRVIRQEKFSSCRIVIKSSKGIRYREVSGTPVYDSNNKFLAGVLLYRDIEDTLVKEENLLIKTQHDLLSRIIENLELGLVRLSYPDFKIVDMNNKFFNNFRYFQLNLELDFSIFKDKYKNIEDLNKALGEKDGVHSATKRFNIRGKERFFKFVYQPLLRRNHEVKELIVLAIEITDEVTEKNKLENILKVQEELVLNISHECRTPLNIIFSTCQLMELYLMEDLNQITKGKVIKNIHSIKQNCNRFIKIINNVIDLSQIEAGESQPDLRNENIVSTIEEMVESVVVYAAEKEIDIIFDTNIEEKYMAVDIDKIERAVINLISNAIKFSKSGDKIHINITDQGDTVEISVADQGIGIEGKYLESVFDRFSQVDKSLMRQAEGSGIGLSLVKAIVDMHGGRISVKSQIGKGSDFKIELPVFKITDSKKAQRPTELNREDNLLSIEFSDIY